MSLHQWFSPRGDVPAHTHAPNWVVETKTSDFNGKASRLRRWQTSISKNHLQSEFKLLLHMKDEGSTVVPING